MFLTRFYEKYRGKTEEYKNSTTVWEEIVTLKIR
jgi:hypothetical protein